MFCGCAAVFGDAPNTNVCPVCLGLPGALPVPNEEAIRLGARAALALRCRVNHRSEFARKNYFYPDLPKGYQISQFDHPLAAAGSVSCESADRGPIEISIERLHLEEDAGKLLHDRLPESTAIDLNRAGVPLAEIVTGPDLRSPAEARSFLVTLKQILQYLEVSECSMEKGSLRVDANISIRRTGDPKLGTKTEVKNLNSFANVERALELEQHRQRGVVESGGSVAQMTMLFNATTSAVRPMRSKEESHDYRYFPDPDLPPIRLTGEWIQSTRAALPELPAARVDRLTSAHGLSGYDARVLTAERSVADYYEAVLSAGAEPKAAANWVMGEILAHQRDSGRFPVPPPALAELIQLVAQGTVSRAAAKQVLGHIAATGERPAVAAERLGLVQVRDDNALDGWIDAVVSANAEAVARYRNGETKLIAFFVGQVMKGSRGAADPKAAAERLARRLQ
jgi:aspartyl-tRNA(Asn)/glutamyl-tRNA(Gln) amidotransferase subunit B